MVDTAADGAVEQVRRFNRVVTQRVGALDDAFLSRDRPLGQARLLWEIGADGRDLRELRSRLDLDSGYLSRLLRALTADGLVAVEADPADARARRARLTPAGAAERAELDRRAEDRATAILRPLSGAQRERLVAAMAEVERLLVASMVDLTARDPRHPDGRHCLAAYFAELGRRFETGFDPAVSNPLLDADMTPPAGLLLVATLHDEPVGCGALRFHADDHAAAEGRRAGDHGAAEDRATEERSAEIKRMWVSPGVRGLGVGRRLLTELEALAAEQGVRVLRLETNRTLVEAVGPYRTAGYHEVPAFNDEPYAHHWFEKRLTP